MYIYIYIYIVKRSLIECVGDNHNFIFLDREEKKKEKKNYRETAGKQLHWQEKSILGKTFNYGYMYLCEDVSEFIAA